MFIPLMLLCSIMFMMMKHPLSCGLMLLLQTIFTALITGLMNFNFWFSYILFLIMIGGMLILFIYMTSIASNEKFKFNSKFFIMFIITFLTMSFMFMMDYYYFNFNMKIMDSVNIFTNMSMMKYINFPNNIMMLIMIIYLFITLIAIVKIAKTSYGPLRQKF
uniref:NADH-ubiquinone oxidoreductase chain 6 n=1 Tax=Calomicrus pinicola TaxID=1553172 RepID=A0A343C157_9CUCU|nr:NADH dehydrogenase subunit 6 [Calomicrus pinicola]